AKLRVTPLLTRFSENPMLLQISETVRLIPQFVAMLWCEMNQPEGVFCDVDTFYYLCCEYSGGKSMSPPTPATPPPCPLLGAMRPLTKHNPPALKVYMIGFLTRG